MATSQAGFPGNYPKELFCVSFRGKFVKIVKGFIVNGHAPLEKRAIWNYNDYPLTFQKKKRTFIKKREKLQKNMAQKVINDKEITEYYSQNGR